MSPCVLGKLTVRMAHLTKPACVGSLVAVLAAISPTASFARSATPVAPPPSSGFDVPATKLLAIGSFTAKATRDVWQPIPPSEVRETVRLYLAGKIDQWFVKQDQSGVVFIMNLTDPKQAHDLLDKLPLGQAGLMEFQLIPLGPLSPLRALLSESTR
jgi:hypothetical protein